MYARPIQLILLAAVISIVGGSYCADGDDNGIISGLCASPEVYGLNFGPFIGGKDPEAGDQVSEEELRELMTIIVPHTQWIRTFGCGSGQEIAGQIAHELGIKAAIGAWLSSDLTANEREIASLINISLAGEADLAIVGSEVLLRDELSEEQLIGYINRVKEAVPGIPVTTACTYDTILSHPAIITAVDVVFVNYYPYWSGIEVDQALDAIDSWHQQVIAASGGKEVIVSETGWPSCGNQIGGAVPSPENAAFYFQSFASWAEANDVPYFYFEAFDERWKVRHEGPQGACWGIWDDNVKLKPGFGDELASSDYKVLDVSTMFVPSGFMGDVGDISINEYCEDNPRSGPYCIEVIYTAEGSSGARWAGIYWQYPANNWGNEAGWIDTFNGATKLTFWARGKNGLERAEFKMGGITGRYSDSVRPAVTTGIITLSAEWKQYEIDLANKNLSHVIGGFCWVTNIPNNPDGCTIYLDDLRYEW